MTTREAPAARRAWSMTRPLRLFATSADEPRARRASDVIMLVTSATALLAISVAAEPQPRFLRLLSDLVDGVPRFLDSMWQVLADLFVVLAAVLVIGAIVRRRGTLVRDLLLAGTLAVVIALLVGRIVEGDWPSVWGSLRSAQPPPQYPSVRLAVAAAVVITASPHVTRPVRRLGRWLTAAAMLAVIALGAGTALGAVAGLLVAAIAAAIVHLVFGSSGGRPSLDLVDAALTELGVPVASLGAADRQQAGMFLVTAHTDAGDQLVVKVYGRDAHDAALVSTIWRTVWYREAGSPLRFGRLQQVEHEAFLTLFARQAGIATDTVVTAGATVDDDALLVLARDGSPLVATSDLPPSDEMAAAVWTVLQRLHARGISHGSVDDSTLAMIGGELGLIDFRGASVAANRTQLRTDEVQALLTTVRLVGPARAAAMAVEALGADEVTAMLPYLQPAALTARQRRQVDDEDLDLDALRTDVAAAAGATPPALQQLRRITVGSIVRVVLPAIALFALISIVVGLDLDALIDTLRDATWWLVALGLLAGQLPRVTQALSTLGSAPVPLPLGPVYALQLAVSYVNLAIPTSAARVAVNIRFFQRHGVPPGGALAAGALDGFGGFVVQLLLLVTLVVFTPASLDIDVGAAVDRGERLLLMIAIIALGAIVVVALMGTLRRLVIEWARRLGTEAIEAVRGLRSPRRLGLLLGGNLATEVLFAVTLSTFVAALGFGVGLGEALLVNLSVSLLAGLVPVPGGIGVVEGGLTYGLVRAGVPEEAAFAAVALYRLTTFYLPPIWGYFAFRWLERNNHL